MQFFPSEDPQRPPVPRDVGNFTTSHVIRGPRCLTSGRHTFGSVGTLHVGTVVAKCNQSAGVEVALPPVQAFPLQMSTSVRLARISLQQILWDGMATTQLCLHAREMTRKISFAHGHGCISTARNACAPGGLDKIQTDVMGRLGL